MTLWELIWRNLSVRRLSSSLTTLSVALGVMLVVGVLLLRAEVEDRFLRPGAGYALVVGAPGSPLQLVLNTVFHLDRSPGLMPVSAWRELDAHPSTRLAVPYAVGDSFRGFRVVATTEAFFDPRFPHPEAPSVEAKFAAGGPFKVDPHQLDDALKSIEARTTRRRTPTPRPAGDPGAEPPARDKEKPEGHAGDEQGDPVEAGEDHDAHEDRDDDESGGPARDDAEPHEEHAEHDDEDHDEDHDEDPHEDGHDDEHEHHGSQRRGSREAVVGAVVAARLGVRVNDRIEPTHGVEGGEAHHHAHYWTVVGVLKETGTPVDELVLINLDSFYRIDEHAGGVLPESGEPGLSAVVLFPKGGMHKAMVLTRLNKRSDLQVASVERQIRRLLGIVGRVDQLFLWVALLVVVIGLMSIMVAITNTMAGRRHELATLRALGARRRFVVAAIVGEATALAFFGAIVGVLLGHALVWASAGMVAEAAGFQPDALKWLLMEPLLIVCVTLAGALAGLAPAWRAYQTDVASHLSEV